MILALLAGCSKELGTIKPIAMSSITVVNTLMNSDPLVLSFFPDSPAINVVNTSPQIGSLSANEYYHASGPAALHAYEVTDTTYPLFTGMLDLHPNAIYSLFFCGQLNGQNGADTLLIEDHPPYHPQGDSTVGIRFANLLPGGDAVSVNLAGSPSGSEASGLHYKSLTEFKTYEATTAVPGPGGNYIFEFRSVASDSLLASFTYDNNDLARFRNVTIVLAGVPGDNNTIAAATFLINNF